MPVSATHGHGTGDLLDRLAELARASRRGGGAAEDEAESPVRVAVIGRPNVGKSSLVNAFLGAERVIVSELAGTTRDAIDTELEFDGRGLVLVDTAGLRRRTKVAGTVAYYAQLRSERAAERADVALVVCDASEGVTSEDLRVAELAMRSGCATLVALNKWDVGRTDLEDATARLAQAAPAAPAGDHLLGAHRPQRAEAARALDRARRPARIADPDARAEPVRRRRGGEPAAAGEAGQAPAPLLRGAGGAPAAAVRDPGQRPPADQRASGPFTSRTGCARAYGLEGVPLVIDFVPHSRRSRERPGLARVRGSGAILRQPL